MKHLIKIDDRSKTGKNLVELLRELSKSSSAIDIVKAEEESETIPFEVFAEELRTSIRTKLRKKK